MLNLDPDFAVWGLLIVALVAVLLGAMFMFFQFRQTRYSNELKRVELDQSRQVLEREISRLHEKLYRDDGRWEEMNHLVLDSLSKIESVDKKLESKSLRSPVVDDLIEGRAKRGGVDFSSVFVLTPFAENEQYTFDTIRRVCSELGLNARRGDEKKVEGPLLNHIIEEIKRSGLIIANLNGRNANVFYELGLAQAYGKPCIMVANFKQEIPFDLEHQQLVLYRNKKDLADRLSDALAKLALSEMTKYNEGRTGIW